MYTCKLAPTPGGLRASLRLGTRLQAQGLQEPQSSQQPQLGWGTGRARPKKAGRWKCGALGMLENGMGCVNHP